MNGVFPRRRPHGLSVRGVAMCCLLMALGACGGGGGNGDGNGSTVTPSTSPDAVGQLGLLLGGLGGPGNVDGVGVQARLNAPSGLVIDPQGNLYVSDTGNALVRKITPGAEVTTLATGFQQPTAMARDTAGNLLVVDGNLIRRVSPSGAVSTVAKDNSFSSWQSLAVDGGGAIYGVERTQQCLLPGFPCHVTEQVKKVRVADPDATVLDTVAGLQPAGGAGPGPLFTVVNDAKGRVLALRFLPGASNGLFDFFEANAGGSFDALNLPEAARRLTGLCDGCTTNQAWRLHAAWDGDGGWRVAVQEGGGGHLATGDVTAARFFRDGTPPSITMATQSGAAGSSFPSSGFRTAAGIAVNAQGQLYVADSSNHTIRVIGQQGEVQAWAGQAANTELQDSLQSAQHYPFAIPFCDVAVAANGIDVYAHFCYSLKPPPSVMLGSSQQILRIAGNAVVEVVELSLSAGRAPFGVDSAGDFYMDGRRFSHGGALKADWSRGDEGFFARLARVGPQDRVFLASHTQVRFLAPGAAAPVVLAGQPDNDPSDSLTAMDGQGTSARFASIRDLAVDAAGNAYVVDGGNLVRKISPSGDVRTLAGRPGASGADDGPGATATFSSAQGVAVDRKGNLYVADTGNHTVRKITAEGVVSTLVGQTGQAGVSVGALPGRLASPTSVAVDANDVLYIATPGAVLKVKLPQQ